jgi:lysophospholipase L1-like esterase
MKNFSECEYMRVIPSVFVIGDSHTHIFSQSPLFQVFHIGPATAYNLIKKDSSTKANEKIDEILNIVKSGDIVILVFGEIDCRIHIFYQFKKKQETQTISELIQKTIHNYCTYVNKIKNQGIEVCVCGITPPGEEENIYDYPYYAEKDLQQKIYREFNNELKIYCNNFKINFLDIFPMASDDSGFLSKTYSDDGLHLNAKMLPLIEKMLQKKYGMKLILRYKINQFKMIIGKRK